MTYHLQDGIYEEEIRYDKASYKTDVGIGRCDRFWLIVLKIHLNNVVWRYSCATETSEAVTSQRAYKGSKYVNCYFGECALTELISKISAKQELKGLRALTANIPGRACRMSFWLNMLRIFFTSTTAVKNICSGHVFVPLETWNDVIFSLCIMQTGVSRYQETPYILVWNIKPRQKRENELGITHPVK